MTTTTKRSSDQDSRSNLWMYLAILLTVVIVGGAVLVWTLWPAPNAISIEDYDSNVSTESIPPFVFSRDVVLEGQLNRLQVLEEIRFDPPIEGKFRWTSPRHLQFFPEEKLKPATVYAASNFSYLAARFGLMWQGSDRVELRTPLLIFLQDFPVHITRDRSNPSLMHITFELTFNEEVIPDDLAEHLTIEHSTLGEIGFEIVQIHPSKVLAVSSEVFESPSEDDPLNITIHEGLVPFTGTIPLESSFKRTVAVTGKLELKVHGLYTQREGRRNSIRVRFNHAVDPEQARTFIELVPEIDEPVYQTDGSYLLIQSPDIKSGKTYTVSISEGLTALNGALLEVPFLGKLKIEDLPPSLHFGATGMFLLRGGNENLKLINTNIDEFDLEVGRIFRNNLVPWLNRVEGRRAQYGIQGRELEILGNVLIEEKIQSQGLQNEDVEHILNVREYVQEERGIYQFIASSSNRRWQRAVQWVVLTDLGMRAKVASDELWIWVHSLETTKPVPNVDVELLSRNNQTLLTGTTDSDGKVMLKGYKAAIEGFTPYVILARKGEDLSFVRMETNRLSDAEFDVAGLPYLVTGYEAYLYSERGIYRPGDKAHIVAIVRGANQLNRPDPFPVRFVVKDPDNAIIGEVEKRLNDQGAAEIAWDVPVYGRTGNYRVELHLADQIIGRTRIRVEEFMPDRIKVRLETEADQYLLDEELRGKAIGQMLFGPPASGKDVQVEYRLENRPFKVLEFSTFSFSAPEREYPGKTVKVFEGKLNDQGEREFISILEEKIKPPSGLQAVLSATVRESGGRAVSSYKVINVDPYTHYVGIRRNTERPLLGQDVNFNLIVLNRDGTTSTGRQVDVELYRVRYHWNYILVDGKHKWVSEKQRIKVHETSFTSSDSAISVSLPASDWGKYLLEATDIGSGMMASDEFWASGWGSQPWNVENPEKLEITLDKSMYQVGERAEVVIKSPFPGRLILTLETGRILYSRSYDMPDNTITVPVRIEQDHIPNIYVSASVIRSPVGLLEHERTRAYGITPIMVSNPQHQLQVRLETVAEMRPLQKLKIDYSVLGAERQTYLTIAAVDEGILQLIDFETPNPFGFFYGKRGLGIETYDMYAELLPELADLTPSRKTGGDAADMVRRKKYLPTSAVKRVKPVVMWSGLVQADEGGQGSVEFDVPQFNGQLRLMAIVFSDNRFGNATESVTVRDPIVLTPTFPRFIAGDDRFIVPVEVFNGTGRDGTFTVNLDVTGNIQFRSPTAQTVSIDSKQNGFVSFTLEAPIGLKPIQAILMTEGNGERVSMTTDIPLRPPYPVHTMIDYLVVQPGKRERFTFPEKWYPGTGEFHLHVSGIPKLQYARGLQYLLEYPYGCAEQTASRLFPLLYFDDLALELEPSLFESGSVDYFINEGIQKLSNMQQRDGSFTFWPWGYYHVPWVSLYVGHFLAEARQAGYEVPNRVFNDALKWCKVVAVSTTGREADRWRNLTNKVYANYVLARAGKANRNAINYLKNYNLDDLPAFSRYQLAAIYAELGDLTTARLLIPKSARIPGSDERQRFHSPIRANAIMLDALLEIDPDHSQIPYLFQNLNSGLGERGRWYNTQENAFALLALGKYYHRQGPSIPPLGTIRIAGEQSVQMTGEELHLESAEWSGTEVRIQVDNEGKAFAYWIASGIPTEDLTLREDQGVWVRREFYDESGNQITGNEFVQGQLVIVKITARTLDKHIDDVIILDLLPAGFEVENIRLSSRQQVGWLDEVVQDTPQYIDHRDDRVILATDLPDRPVRRRSPSRSRLPRTAGTEDRTKYFYYVLRAVTQGEFTLPVLTAEAMYDPALHSVSGGGKVTIIAQE